MTRYEQIVNMNIEQMANSNIESYFGLYENKYIIQNFRTSDGRVFNHYEDALEHEIEWLNTETELDKNLEEL